MTAAEQAHQTGTAKRDIGQRRELEPQLAQAAAAETMSLASARRDHSAEQVAEEKFRLAFDACPSGMVMTDVAGTIMLVNAETERLFGYGRDELIGRSMKILVPEQLHERYQRYRAAFAREPKASWFGASRDLCGRRRDGSQFPVEVGLNPIQTRDGLLVLSVIVDISERRRMDRLKDEFVSTVSHELRTPLTSIAGSLGLLIGGAAGKLPEPALRLLGIAQTNSQRLVRLINDILDIEKIESGQVAFDFKRADVRSLVETAIEANRGYADGFGVTVRLDPASVPGEVYADTDRLAQVLTNLLSNALKFSPPGNEVLVGIEQRERVVLISVRDHGPGIPAEFRPRVFEKFAQADATDARQKGGTGLGLSIVKQIVTRLGGTVGFADAPDGGTIFFVELPSWAQAVDREIDPEGSAAAVRILLCESDPDTAIALREGLRPAGFSTDFAYCADDAVARVQATTYAAVVVDLDVSGGEGLGLVRRLRQQSATYATPIVMLVAEGSGKAIAPSCDVLDWVRKPVDIAYLAQTLGRAALHGANGRPRILHVDDDHDILDLVAQKLASTANVISVDSLGEARRALLHDRFDLVILDIALGKVSGLDLLPDLRNGRERPIPVVIFSASAAGHKSEPQVEASLDKSLASLDNLVAVIHDRLALESRPEPKELA